jgi:hypothetical protein
VALNVALAEFAEIETVAGTVMFPVDPRVILVATATGLLMDIVQTATPPGASDVGLQLIPLRTETIPLDAVPPAALTVIPPPSRAAPSAPETATEAETASGASVSATVATTPSSIRFVLMPVATHIYVPEAPAQFNVLPAAVNAEPAVTLKPATEEAG